MSWIDAYATQAARTDRLKAKPDHLLLLAAGLVGEGGSLLAEAKKRSRDGEAYVGYHERILEEFGDFLWYYVRLVSCSDPRLLATLSDRQPKKHDSPSGVVSLVHLSVSASQAVTEMMGGTFKANFHGALVGVWNALCVAAATVGIALSDAAARNVLKIRSRWPEERLYTPLFDEDFPVSEQLPRQLEADFGEEFQGVRTSVTLSSKGVAVGDSLTDNIRDPDGYRFHDIFHLSYAVHLGWSPVLRSLLHRKRKSNPIVDEAEDGARAAIIEESVSAIVFGRAKSAGFFRGIEQLDYELLKTVQRLVAGFEVERVALWQWEVAILDGYRAFRKLRANGGGKVNVDVGGRELRYLTTAHSSLSDVIAL